MDGYGSVLKYSAGMLLGTVWRMWAGGVRSGSSGSYDCVFDQSVGLSEVDYCGGGIRGTPLDGLRFMWFWIWLLC